MSDPIKIDGLPVKQCQFRTTSFNAEKELQDCAKKIEQEQSQREAAGEKCSDYMQSFGDAGGITTVLTLVCKGKNSPNAHKSKSKSTPAPKPAAPGPQPKMKTTPPPKPQPKAPEVWIPSGPNFFEGGLLIFTLGSQPA